MEFIQKHRRFALAVSVVSFLAIVITSVLSMFMY